MIQRNEGLFKGIGHDCGNTTCEVDTCWIPGLKTSWQWDDRKWTLVGKNIYIIICCIVNWMLLHHICCHLTNVTLCPQQSTGYIKMKMHRHSGTFLIRILCPKIVKIVRIVRISQNCLLIIFYYYNRSIYVMCYHLHLFTIMYNYSILFIIFYGRYNTFT